MWISNLESISTAEINVKRHTKRREKLCVRERKPMREIQERHRATDRLRKK